MGHANFNISNALDEVINWAKVVIRNRYVQLCIISMSAMKCCIAE